MTDRVEEVATHIPKTDVEFFDVFAVGPIPKPKPEEPRVIASRTIQRDGTVTTYVAPFPDREQK